MGASLVHDKLLPRPPGGIAPGAALAVVVHAGLIAALTLGVDWRTHSPEVVSAELWAAVPQSAAPPPPPPVVEPPAPTPAPTPAPAPPPVARTEPPPPPPDIALERERKKAEAERKKAELEAELKAERQRDADKKKADDERKKREQQEERRAADKAAQQKAAEQAEDERLAKQREENLRRMMGQAGATAGATGTTGSAAQNAAPSTTYAGKVKAAVRPNIVFTGMAEFNAAAEVEVSAAPGGSIIARRLIKSSGYKDWDEAVLRAIDKTRNLPRDTDGRVPTLLIISFRPND